MITFATFHSDLPPETVAEIHRHEERIQTNSFDWAGAAREDISRDMIAMMFASARRLHPDCRQVIITDEVTPFEDSPDVTVFRSQLDGQPPSIGRVIAWIDFLSQAPPHSHIVLLDYDVFIQSNLDALFDQPFDVGLTYREHRRWPVNAGIQFLHGDRLTRGQAFFENVRDIFQEKYRDWELWCGDQWAIQEMVQADFSGSDTFMHTQNGFEMLLLPGHDYNFSAEEGHWDLGDPSYQGKKVLHFKGPDKPAMFEYWKTYLEPLCRQGSR